ncbi:hypothetical protein WA026_006126 [Henosepilachna vigintioctopunctata]|uniref:alpha-glucosidase n=1 Tax=Henosepilachna vigintioctopunctata TaxID=420089 RepID=A0AAW1TQH3_9CUCU
MCAVLLLCIQVEETSEVLADEAWWKHAVFYQIYPRSFKDSDNDGNGDLLGILDKLKHLVDAGVTGVWLSPIFKSPQKDAGYDISDYYSVDPLYGSIADLKRLIEEAHRLRLKIILDFVPNHTSNQHKWFIASENGEEYYKDFYVWVNGTSKKPPNNWISVFKDSAWKWSNKRQQWYLHQFLDVQPDLNYRNKDVRKALHQILIYYMDIGIDGFRVDAVPFFVEDKLLRNEPRTNKPNVQPNDPDYLNHIYTRDTDETFEVVYELREVVDNYTRLHGGDARILMTEAYSSLDKTQRYYGTYDGRRLGAHFSFNFYFVKINLNKTSSKEIRDYVETWINSLPKIYVSNWVIGNHDNSRAATRFGPKNVDGFNILVSLLPGIGVTYNGEEIGQEDGEVSFEESRDPSARNKSTFKQDSRDFERTPFQWDTTLNAGFNRGHRPWLPVSEKYHQTNLAAQKNSSSLTHYKIYREVLKKRQEPPAKYGDTNISAFSEDVLILKRSLGSSHIVLVFKFGGDKSPESERVYIPSIDCNIAKIALTNIDSDYSIGATLDPRTFVIKSHESLLLDITC